MNDYQKQVEETLKLSGPKRYDYFIREVAKNEELWGLFNEGWALAGTDDGKEVFPVWPEKVYAEMCIETGWDDNEAKPINLFEFMEDLLPELQEDGIMPCIFFLPSDKGVLPSVEQLLEDLRTELQRI